MDKALRCPTATSRMNLEFNYAWVYSLRSLRFLAVLLIQRGVDQQRWGLAAYLTLAFRGVSPAIAQ